MTMLEFGAKWFAVIAHALAYNRRKFTDEPYSVHCWEIVKELKYLKKIDKHLFAAAWLHDVVEDAGVSLETIRFFFGDKVYLYVWYMTDQARVTVYNRRTRKEMSKTRLSLAPYELQLLKIADCYNNAISIYLHDPNFWPTYRGEIKELMKEFKPYDENMGHEDLFLRLRLKHILEHEDHT